MTDLIERLKHEAIDLHEWAHAGKGGEPAEITANLLDEAIAALTPVLPDDVADIVHMLRNEFDEESTLGGDLNRAADMLERLARENQRWPIFLAAQIESDLKIAESLRQRIAELEDERNAFEGSFIAATKRIAELENRNTALLMLIDKDEQHIAELKSLLSVAKCPCCNGDGAYYDGMGEVCQCQWCYEVNEALPPEQPK